MKHSAFALLLLCAAAAVLPARGRKQPDLRPAVSIVSEPSGAEISYLGRSIGKTPLNGKIGAGVYLFKAEKAGFQPQWLVASLENRKKTDLRFRLTPVVSQMLVTSTPSGASVSFRGREIGVTPIVVPNLEYGRHSFSLKAPGFAPAVFEAGIDSPRPKILKCRLVSSMGSLLVKSSPAGAMVSVNGVSKGTAPITLRLEQGEYKVSVVKSGFLEFVRTAVVNKDTLTKLDVRLESLPSDLAISSKPQGAAVSINGKEYGSAPISLRSVPAGIYRIHVRMDGYDPVDNIVNLAPGQKLDLNVDLVANTGSISLTTSPPGVDVYVDRKLAGTTLSDNDSTLISKPFRISKLTPGRYTLKFTHKLADPPDKIMEVVVEKGRELTLPAVELWVRNASVTFNDGTQVTGRLLQKFPDGGILFESERGVKIRYRGNEIKSVRMIMEKE